MVILVPIAALARRRATLWPLLIALGLLIGPWMGLCLPWGTLQGGGPKGVLKVRVITCNVGGGKAVGLASLIESSSPDIVVIEELREVEWASSLFPEPGWHFQILHGGIGLASRFPIAGAEARPLAKPDWAEEPLAGSNSRPLSVASTSSASISKLREKGLRR